MLDSAVTELGEQETKNSFFIIAMKEWLVLQYCNCSK
jgi:hypothetical protein